MTRATRRLAIAATLAVTALFTLTATAQASDGMELVAALQSVVDGSDANPDSEER